MGKRITIECYFLKLFDGFFRLTCAIISKTHSVQSLLCYVLLRQLAVQIIILQTLFILSLIVVRLSGHLVDLIQIIQLSVLCYCCFELRSVLHQFTITFLLIISTSYHNWHSILILFSSACIFQVY